MIRKNASLYPLPPHSADDIFEPIPPTYTPFLSNPFHRHSFIHSFIHLRLKFSAIAIRAQPAIPLLQPAAPVASSSSSSSAPSQQRGHSFASGNLYSSYNDDDTIIQFPLPFRNSNHSLGWDWADWDELRTLADIILPIFCHSSPLSFHSSPFWVIVCVCGCNIGGVHWIGLGDAVLFHQHRRRLVGCSLSYINDCVLIWGILLALLLLLPLTGKG